ncbi:MAG: serine hydrolase, partial [Dermatophilaceae bacterium]
ARSAYFDKRYAVPDLAEGYDRDERGRLEQNIYAYPPRGQADGGAFSTADDLHTFVDAVRCGDLLSPATTELFFTPQVDIEPETPGYRQGFGLAFNEGRYWKEGESEGASGILLTNPDESADLLDVVVLSNSAEGAWPVIDEIKRLTPAWQ